MRKYAFIIVVFGLTGCGREPVTGGEDGTLPATKVVVPEVDDPASDKKVAPGAEKGPAVAPKEPGLAKGPAELPELTKDQKRRLYIRQHFDRLLAGGKLLKVEPYGYFARGDAGTMGWPDSQYLPLTTENISNRCPLGFEIPDTLELSAAISVGLYSTLPPEADWVWTSDSYLQDGVAYMYYAFATRDLTDPWGYAFQGGQDYKKYRDRVVGRAYCRLSVVPEINDIPDGWRGQDIAPY